MGNCRFTLELDKELLAELDRVARTHGLTKSSAGRLALRAWVMNPGLLELPTSKAPDPARESKPALVPAWGEPIGFRDKETRRAVERENLQQIWGALPGEPEGTTMRYTVPIEYNMDDRPLQPFQVQLVYKDGTTKMVLNPLYDPAVDELSHDEAEAMSYRDAEERAALEA